MIILGTDYGSFGIFNLRPLDFTALTMKALCNSMIEMTIADKCLACLLELFDIFFHND